MPSTYSNLKIQLMATGENTTTWGNVTNVNLGTAIEEAIAGSADVTFASNNQTLTLADTNATQAARNLRLRCTGTTGGSTRDLVVPSIEKPYIVQNDCADAITVKTSAGTGIAVPAGKTMWVYSDGTNVVDVANHLTSLTLGAPLAVAQGGTGSNTASGGRTNLGSTTVGDSFFTLANPDAITFPRINANNTVTTRSASDFRGDIGAAPIDNPTFTNTTTTATADLLGSVRGNVTTVSASDVDCSLGNYFTKTASGALTWTFSNAPSTRSYSFLLELTNGGTGAQTWPASVDWPGGVAPTLTTSGVDMLGFITDDGGTIWRGVLLMKDSK